MAFKERSPLFSARQRSTFILFDGIKTVQQVLIAAAGLGITQEDVDYMQAQGFLSAVASDQAVTAPSALAAAPPEPVSSRTHQERYADAKPIATALTAGLGLRGFRLNLSVESAAGYTELLALFPKIQEAVGPKLSRDLERALKG
ncbi:MAG: hypothetical protein RLZ68_499 [Pseudomonadota bacterium]